jgi:2-polyprenyl-3-methyl-5-hydroxy-6-metoxy-1,4-benzoquinol methylase
MLDMVKVLACVLLIPFVLWGIVFLSMLTGRGRRWFTRAYYAAQMSWMKKLASDEARGFFTNWGYVSDKYPCHADDNKNFFHSQQVCCKNLYRACIESAGSLPGRKVLEVGCGKGAGSQLFDGWDYTGIDVSEKSIQHCQERCKGRFLVLDANRVDELDTRFDLIINVESLFHYRNLHDYFIKIRDRLAPGGVYVATTIVTRKDAYRQLSMFGALPGIQVIDITPNVMKAIECWRPAKNRWQVISRLGQTLTKERLRLILFAGPHWVVYFDMIHWAFSEWRYFMLVYRYSQDASSRPKDP